MDAFESSFLHTWEDTPGLETSHFRVCKMEHHHPWRTSLIHRLSAQKGSRGRMTSPSTRAQGRTHVVGGPDKQPNF